MDEYILQEEYYKSIRGEDGEEPLAVHGSRPRTDLGSYMHCGPLSDRAETASLPRRPRPEYPRACCPTQRAPEVSRLELRNNIMQGQPTVPWTIRPNCWPNFCLDRKIQM